MPRTLLPCSLLCLLALLAGCQRQPATPPASSSAHPLAAQPAASANAATPTSSLTIEPDAGFSWLYALVNSAKTSIDLTMYELVDTTFSADLVQACGHGVKVRVILDQSLEKTANTPAYNQLSAAGPNCTVAWSNPQFQATHQKTLILDGKTAVVMTFNLTNRYYAETRDLAYLDTDTKDIAAIQATFNTDFHSATDKTYQPGSGDNLIWSPTTAQPDLLGIINGAKKTLLVENEELGAANIVSALAAACKRKVAVSLAMTDTSAAYHANYTTLQNAGCGVHIGANNSTTLYVHAKAMVADLGTPSATGYLGSINFSNASMTENRELGLYLHDPATLSQIASTLTADFNQFPSFSTSRVLSNTRRALP